jgi:tryptophan-rich sensory protein
MTNQLAFGFISLMLFLLGAFFVAFAERHRDYVIREMNSPSYIPRQRAIGVFFMLVAVALGVSIAAKCGVDFSWASFKL